MKWIFSLLFLAVIIAILDLWYLEDPGKVTIIWLNYEVEFSLITFFIFYITLSYVLFKIFRALHFTQSTFSDYISFFLKPNKKKERNIIPNHFDKK